MPAMYGRLMTHTVNVEDPSCTYADQFGHVPLNICFSVEKAEPDVGYFRDYIVVESLSYLNPEIPYSVAERHEEAAVEQVKTELGLI